MPLGSNCNETLFSSQIQDYPLILEKLRWESGPASIPNPDKVLPIIHIARRELEDCEKQIEALESRRESLQEYAALLQSLLSPIRKVPDEILQHIFDDCCDMKYFTVGNHQKSPNAIRNAPALAVSSVCSRWRRNGLSMPSIWSRISLSRYVRAVVDFTALETVLNRTPQHPLTIVIDFSPDFNKYPVFTLLKKHTHRWYSFTDKSRKEFRHDELRYSFISIFLHPDPALKFPLLEYLDIVDIEASDLKMLAHASPKLKKLSTTFIPDGTSVETSLFAQLSHLELRKLSVPKIQALFRSSHRLVSLETEESVNPHYAETVVPCRTIDTLTVYLNPALS
ncbi:hypothetical protein BT96DRAFT_314174 [Gymnopus androsaceus JB14]|uniref:Uncharacterized protein n=1 Tax=Gymnopus androsaceus JB14 TaxID=1447944 RepID=A0A6A4IA66_9AGAR|nr:hypothetical protein BT96DRAFT_314174 [Gymnopus androsaceus JB14]